MSLTTDTDSGALRRGVMLAAAALALAVAAMGLRQFLAYRQLQHDAQESGDAAPRLPAVSAEPDHGGGAIVLPGELDAWNQSTIYARVNGYVAHWYADIGDRVAAGQLLAQIDTPELDAELQAAQAELKVAQAQLQLRRADADLAAQTWVRWRDSPAGVVSEQERDDKKSQDEGARAQVEAASARVARVRADIERLTALTRFKRVTAPYSGTIVRREVDLGDLVSAGSTSGTTSLYRIQRSDQLRAFVDVPQLLAAQLLKPGQTVQIESMGDSPVVLEGKVARTSAALDPKSRTLKVEVDLDNARGQLLAGANITVRLHLPGQGLVKVPAAALLFRGGMPQVAVVDATDTVRLRNVVIGRDDGETVALSAGVRAGENVLLNVGNDLTDGAHVQIQLRSAARTPARSAL